MSAVCFSLTVKSLVRAASRQLLAAISRTERATVSAYDDVRSSPPSTPTRAPCRWDEHTPAGCRSAARHDTIRHTQSGPALHRHWAAREITRPVDIPGRSSSDGDARPTDMQHQSLPPRLLLLRRARSAATATWRALMPLAGHSACLTAREQYVHARRSQCGIDCGGCSMTIADASLCAAVRRRLSSGSLKDWRWDSKCCYASASTGLLSPSELHRAMLSLAPEIPYLWTALRRRTGTHSTTAALRGVYRAWYVNRHEHRTVS